jgi:hypothetical protein
MVRSVEILLHSEISKKHLQGECCTRLAIESAIDDSTEAVNLEKHAEIHKATLFAGHEHGRFYKNHASFDGCSFPSITERGQNSRNQTYEDTQVNIGTECR